MTKMRLRLVRSATRGLGVLLALGFAAGPVLAEIMRVTAPAATSAVHPGSDDALTFESDPSDLWLIESDASQGATVDFVASQPFTHVADSFYQRDVELELVVAAAEAAAGWAVTAASDSTDYVSSITTATVSAASTAAGNADFDLTVTLDTQSFSTMAAGEYTTTITATLIAN